MDHSCLVVSRRDYACELCYRTDAMFVRPTKKACYATLVDVLYSSCACLLLCDGKVRPPRDVKIAHLFI